MKILIAPNSFKESITSAEICEILTDELHKLINLDKIQIEKMPISDGGDGFLDSIEFSRKTEKIFINLDFPYKNESINKTYFLLDKQNKTIYIESAKIIGLNLIPTEFRNPLEMNSKAIGDLLFWLPESEIKNEFDTIIIGIGGTATQDLGLGILIPFGLEAFRNGEKLEILPKFYQDFTELRLNEKNRNYPFKIKIVNDVENPLLGKSGTNYVFANQKGISENEIQNLELGFENVVKLLEKKDISKLTGAGGGISAIFQIFFNAEIISSTQFILNELGLSDKDEFDIVITGEGQFDFQTNNNKAPNVIRNFYKNKNLHIIYIFGNVIGNFEKLENETIYVLNDFFNNLANSKKFVKNGLVKVSKLISERITEITNARTI